MTHLSADELIDALEAHAEGGNTARSLAPERHAHLSTCADCQRQLADLATVLNEAKQLAAGEPSPLFWKHLSANINAEIDKQLETIWPVWLRWQVLVPLAAVALIVVALIFSVRQPAHVSSEIVDNTPSEATLDAGNWVALAELVGDLDVDAAFESGVVAPGIADQAVLELTAEEQQELTRLLQAELTRAKS